MNATEIKRRTFVQSIDRELLHRDHFFSTIFREVFPCFRKFSEAFGRVRTHSDPRGPIGMHAEAFGSIWKHLDVLDKFETCLI